MTKQQDSANAMVQEFDGEGYGRITVEKLSLDTFVDANLYSVVDESGQPAIYREKDPYRFVLMAALAYGVETRQALLEGKKILDVGCGGGQISASMARYALGVWLADPDCANPKNPARSIFKSNFIIDAKIQDTLELIPELGGFFDLVTSFAPHPFPLNLATLSDALYQESRTYYESLMHACKSGGDVITMPIYERDLGLKNGVGELIALWEDNFAEVNILKVTMPKPDIQPFFSVFIVAKNKH